MVDGVNSRRPRDLAALIFALVLPSAITWLYFFAAAEAPAGTQLLVFNVVKAVQFAFPAFWVLAMQRGQNRPQFSATITRRRGVIEGVSFGAIVAVAALVLYAAFLRSSAPLAAASDEIGKKVTGFGIDNPWKFVALGVFYSLIHSMIEEYYWRWFVFGQLCRWTGVAAAIGVSSLGFMAHHVLVLGKFFGFASPLTWLLSAAVAIGGAAWAWLYQRSASILGPWLSHMLVDAAVFAVGFDVARRFFTA